MVTKLNRNELCAVGTNIRTSEVDSIVPGLCAFLLACWGSVTNITENLERFLGNIFSNCSRFCANKHELKVNDYQPFRRRNSDRSNG